MGGQTGHPSSRQLLPLVGQTPRASARWPRPLLGSPCPLLPSPPPRRNAAPSSAPRSLALLGHGLAGRDGRHLRLLDLPLLLCRPPCRRHLSCCCRSFPGALDILVAWGEEALAAAGRGWLQASHGSAGAFTGWGWSRSSTPTTPTSSTSSAGETTSTSHGRGVGDGVCLKRRCSCSYLPYPVAQRKESMKLQKKSPKPWPVQLRNMADH